MPSLHNFKPTTSLAKQRAQGRRLGGLLSSTLPCCDSHPQVVVEVDGELPLAPQSSGVDDPEVEVAKEPTGRFIVNGMPDLQSRKRCDVQNTAEG